MRADFGDDHRVEPTAETVHSVFSRDLKPILTIQSGERVSYRTLCAQGSAYDPEQDALVTADEVFAANPRQGHALCGPIVVEGAEPGMTLAVHVEHIAVDGMGWNEGGGPNGGELWERLGVAGDTTHRFHWRLDDQNQTATMADTAYRVPLAPFMGVMGMPPAKAGEYPTAPPRVTGGNIDCKLLMVGSTLYLPVPVAGGLFSVGDGHAAQGDGEVGGTAIECPMRQVDLRFTLSPDIHLTTPRAYTPSGWLTFGFHEDLNEAKYTALNAMLDLLTERYGVTRPQAMALASAVVDLHVTQIVNGVQGVHALLPHDAIRT